MTATTIPDPANMLLTLVATLLAPMFLTATGGDIITARLAAMETINDYLSQNRADLLAVAQIVAFGLCALGSLGLSMADDLSLSMTLRLRGNANSLNRCAEHNRRALTLAQPEPPAQAAVAPETMTQEDHRREAEAIVAVTEARQAAIKAETETRARPEPTPVFKTLSMQEQQNRAMWAAAIADVAGEFTAGLPNLASAERKLTTRKLAVMGSSVTAILSGAPLPRLQPGALGPMIRSRN